MRLLLERLLNRELHEEVAAGHYRGISRTEILHRDRALLLTDDCEVEQLLRDEWC